ncbi:glycosyltransferase [Maribacter luteus]|uniref:glycosyltransferase n=1 Tax=Maribacter luteus TaxID=2594478 RepID=UPI002493ADDF|nr:glycosyltransferase [Maribacter luteus]
MKTGRVAVTIIVPVYNVEQYLRKCLESLVNQTLRDLEIILVNDCSTDHSEDIILEYKNKDSRIVYLEQGINQGQGLARNYAMGKAKGEYTLFVDSDDYIALDAVETLYLKAKELNLDILEANYYKVYQTYIEKQKNVLFTEVLTGNEYFEIIPYTVGVIWNKLWRTKFITDNNLRFVKEIFEDVIFISKSTLVAKRVFRVNYAFYYYNIRDNSTMTSKVSRNHIESQIKLIKSLEVIYKESMGVKGSDQRLKTLLYTFPSLANFITNFKPEYKQEQNLKTEAMFFLKEKHNLYKREIINCKKIGFKQKILLFISPYLMSFVLSKIKS